MKVIDYKDGIKGEPIRLIYQKQNIRTIEQNIEYVPKDYFPLSPEFAKEFSIQEAINRLPATQDRFAWIGSMGLKNCLMDAAKKFGYYPKSEEEQKKCENVIDLVNNIMDLASYRYVAEPEKIEGIDKSIIIKMSGLINALEIILQQTKKANESSHNLLGNELTIADFTVLGLYLACYDKKELYEQISKALYKPSIISNYLTRLIEEMLPTLLKYGKHVTFYVNEIQADCIKFLYQRAIVPYNIVVSENLCIRIGDYKILDISSTIRFIASIFEFDLSINENSDIARHLVNEKASDYKYYTEKLSKIDAELKGKIDGITFDTKPTLHEIYYATVSNTVKKLGLKEQFPNMVKYAEKWIRMFTRRDKLVLFISNLWHPEVCKGYDYVYYNYANFPLDGPAIFKHIGYKDVELIMVFPDKIKEVAEKIVNREDYKKGEIDVFNFCDGNEADGCTGPSFYKACEDAGLKFAGLRSSFFETADKKHVSKEILTKKNVPTAPYIIIKHPLQLGSTSHMKFPVLIKPSLGFSSVGMTKDCKCKTPEELLKKAEQITKANPDTIYVVESFIEGREFTCVVTGTPTTPTIANWPIERVFNKDYKSEDQWICWEYVQIDASFDYGKVSDPVLAQKIMDISKAAYVALTGVGYTRIDLRQDKFTGEIFVLEANTPPAIGLYLPVDLSLTMYGKRLEKLIGMIISAEYNS